MIDDDNRVRVPGAQLRQLAEDISPLMRAQSALLDVKKHI